jgi:NAD-dependent deacetylase
MKTSQLDGSGGAAHDQVSTMTPSTRIAVEKLRDLVNRSNVVLPFTGAGISTECGIPDFRSPGGLWTKNAPIHLDDFLSSAEMRDEAWRRRFAMEQQFSTARPGRGHRAIAALHHAGKVPGVVTQNIDNLHQASGISHDRVIELHGNTTYATCLSCAKRYELPWVKERFDRDGGHVPNCESCDGYIKTATISFGQAMPELAMRRAQELTDACDLFLAIGSSLVVWPAAGFPVMAKRNGAKLVILNRESTELDEISDLVIHDDIGAVLSCFVTD